MRRDLLGLFDHLPHVTKRVQTIKQKQNISELARQLTIAVIHLAMMIQETHSHTHVVERPCAGVHCESSAHLNRAR